MDDRSSHHAPPLRILILGGSSEASCLARALASDPRCAPTLSLAGRTRTPILPPIAHRIGGFGGIAGLVDYLRTHRIEALIDATHPFAAQMSDHACRAADITQTPILRIERPAWQPVPGDRWIDVPTMAAAAIALGPDPRRVFLTIGQQELAPFRAAPWHDYLIRSIDPPAPALCPPGAAIITARGPFTVEAETALLIRHRIERLVTKNAGAAATAAKLTAARALGMPVIMVARPVLAACPCVTDVAGAVEWLQGKLKISFFDKTLASREAKKLFGA